jgi:hypothetical protein
MTTAEGLVGSRSTLWGLKMGSDEVPSPAESLAPLLQVADMRAGATDSRVAFGRSPFPHELSPPPPPPLFEELRRAAREPRSPERDRQFSWESLRQTEPELGAGEDAT